METGEVLTQWGYSFKNEYWKCKLCDSVWYVSRDADNKDPEKNILSRYKIKYQVKDDNQGKPGQCPLYFFGKWVDANGKKIVIHKNVYGNPVTDIRDSEENPYHIKLLGGWENTSLSLKSNWNGKELIVELGNEGLGPALCLEHRQSVNGSEIIPKILMGLYDDWEDDFGVPWIFPLSEYVIDQHQ